MNAIIVNFSVNTPVNYAAGTNAMTSISHDKLSCYHIFVLYVIIKYIFTVLLIVY